MLQGRCAISTQRGQARQRCASTPLQAVNCKAARSSFQPVQPQSMCAVPITSPSDSSPTSTVTSLRAAARPKQQHLQPTACAATSRRRRRSRRLPSGDSTTTAANPDSTGEADNTPWQPLLWDALHAAATPSRFACSGHVDGKKVPWLCPDISVAGLGRLSLPLSKEQAVSLKAVAEQAPFGKGMQTVVDTKVRDALQVDASQVTIHSSWQPVLDSVVSSVAHALDAHDYATCSIKAHLYKLLLYEEGGHFDAHQDTEKERGMIGTLVVQLPTADGHTGGSLTVRHKGQEFTHHFEEDSANSVQYAALYADCEHELSPITSGMRLVLVYNLVWVGAPSCEPQLFSKSPAETQLQEAWQAWERGIAAGGQQKRIALLLDHQYTKANLSFNHLKGTDRAWARALSTCKGLDAHLVLVTRMVTKYDITSYETRHAPYRRRRAHLVWDPHNDDDNGGVMVHDLEEERTGPGWREETIETGKWIARDGSAIDYGSYGHDLDSLLRDLYDPEIDELFLEEDDPDGENYKPYTGNEGPDVDHIYRRALLVIWPRSQSLARARQAGIRAVLSLLRLRLDTVSAGQGCYHTGPNTAKRDALEALEVCVQLLQDSYNKKGSDIPVGVVPALQQGARAVEYDVDDGRGYAAVLVGRLFAMATAAAKGLADPALAAALADAACGLDTYYHEPGDGTCKRLSVQPVEEPLQQLVGCCMASQPGNCISLIQGVSAQQELQKRLATTALAALPAAMVGALVSLVAAVPDHPVVQQNAVQKVIDSLQGPQAETAFREVESSLHNLDELPVLQQQLAAAAISAVVSLGPTQHLHSCAELIKVCRHHLELQDALVHAVETALRSAWQWQASMAVEVLEALQQYPTHHELIHNAIVESMFNNSGLLKCQTDDSILQLSAMLLSKQQLTETYYSHFAAAVSERPDSYALVSQLLDSLQATMELQMPICNSVCRHRSLFSSYSCCTSGTQQCQQGR